MINNISILVRQHGATYQLRVNCIGTIALARISIREYFSKKKNTRRVVWKSISIGKFQFYSILLFQKVTLSLYHLILQYLQHPKTLFLLKYYFLNFFYYFFPTVTFFQTWFTQNTLYQIGIYKLKYKVEKRIKANIIKTPRSIEQSCFEVF